MAQRIDSAPGNKKASGCKCFLSEFLTETDQYVFSPGTLLIHLTNLLWKVFSVGLKLEVQERLSFGKPRKNQGERSSYELQTTAEKEISMDAVIVAALTEPFNIR